MPDVVTPLDVMRALAEAGVPAIRLDTRADGDAVEADVLVPYGSRRSAARVLDELDWRFEVGRHGFWRVTRQASYGWDDGSVLHLHWSVPAWPLPPRAVARLERAVWECSAPSRGVSIGPELQLAVAAVQRARPTGRRARWTQVAEDAALHVTSWADVVAVADEAKIPGTVRRALRGIGVSAPAPRGNSLRDLAWAASSRLHGRVGSRRIRALVSGTPLLGRSVRRCRFAGIEVLAGSGVFRPMAVTEFMVDAVLDAVEPGRRAIVVEAGTGCGAVALAVAVARPQADVFAADTSRAALRSALRNQRRLGTNVRFSRGSLLEPFHRAWQTRSDVVVGNVPYIPFAQQQAATGDTPGAIVGGGDDGLGLVRRLSVDARAFLRPRGRLVLQLLASQWQSFAFELEALGYTGGTVVGRRGPHVVVVAELT